MSEMERYYYSPLLAFNWFSFATKYISFSAQYLAEVDLWEYQLIFIFASYGYFISTGLCSLI